VSSEIHAAFHVAWKGISRMGVSSSSGCMRLSCSDVKPLSMCWHSYFVVRWFVLSWLAWYIVLWRRSVMWSVISVMSSGTGFVVSGVGRVSGICVAGHLFGLMLVVGAVIRLA
jgi:hypothetical protein